MKNNNKNSAQKLDAGTAKNAIEKLKNLKKVQVRNMDAGATNPFLKINHQLNSDSPIRLSQQTSTQQTPDSESEEEFNQIDLVITKTENLVLRKVSECKKECEGFSWKLFGGVIAMLVVLGAGYFLYIQFRFNKVDSDVKDIKEAVLYKKDIPSKYLNK